MIRRFRHRGLKRLYERDDRSGVNAAHVARLERILTLLDVAQRPADIDLPGYRLHPLKGERKGEWSVSVSGNWRVTFRFDEGDVTDLNYEDYH
jgi:proteic killer suppression protein